MKGIDTEIEEAMAAAGPWRGSTDRMWQKVEAEVRRRQVRQAWVGRLLPVAAAAAVLAAAWAVAPQDRTGTLTPPGESESGPVSPPTAPLPKVPAGSEKRELAGRPLPLHEYLSRQNAIVLGEVVRAQDTAVPCIDPHDNTQCAPFPAKLYTVRRVRLYTGDPGELFRVRQLVPSERVVHPDGRPDPLMAVGGAYLYFLREQIDGIYAESGFRMELGADNRLWPVKESTSILAGLSGLTPDQLAEKLQQLGVKQP